ncbi:MAG TPA: extracellular solute-binding protein [Armatimonadetes bacterium]|jgi:ABC-type sugar transport system permease subunit/ABC-type glycerol-3-phosphate transport system substrate-binding protein|nr:extracellular solute-binding protein [Armatimonadota bacterium]
MPLAYRSLFGFLALWVLALGASAVQAAPVTVNVWQLPNREARTVDQRADLAVLQRFMELHPEIQMDGFRGITAPGMGQDITPLLAMAGGVAPDVLYVNFRISENYIAQGFLAPLDEFVLEWATELAGRPIKTIEEAQPVLSHIIKPQVWPVIYREGPGNEKHVWAIPYGTVVQTLAYRKDLFRKAGLDPDRPPQNWDEVFEYAAKMTNPEEGEYGIGIAAGPQASWHFINFLWSAGGEAVVEENGEWRAVYNSPEAVQALQFYQKLNQGEYIRDGKKVKGVAYRGTDVYTKWTLGKLGMYFQYMNDQVMSQVNPNLIGVGPMPMGPSGKRGNEINATMQGLNATTKDPQIRRAAWEWIKFRAGDEAKRIRTRIYMEAGYAQYLNPEYLKRYLTPEEYHRFSRQVPAGWAETLEEALNSGRPEPYGKNCEMIYTEMTPPIEQAWISTNTDPKYLKSLLDKSVAETNVKLMGLLPPGVKEKRRLVAGLVVLGLIVGFTFVFRTVMRTFAKELEPPPVTGKGWRRFGYAWIVMLPAIVSVAVWQYYPVARGSLMAFQDYKLVLPTTWVGLDNFAEVLFAPAFWLGLKNSARYMIYSLAFGFLTPIALALALNEVPRGKVLFRTLYYLPAVTTGLVIFMLWKQFYDRTPSGLLNKVIAGMVAAVNAVITQLGSNPIIYTPQDWLGDPRWAMMMIIIPLVWAGMGPGCLIYLAALKSIPEEMYEAADLDGAGLLSKIWRITVPYLRPLIIINFVGAFIAAAQAFDAVFIMTGGGPVNTTRVIGLEIFYTAYIYQKFGYAVAMAWIVGALLVGFTVLQLRILSRVQFKTAQA